MAAYVNMIKIFISVRNRLEITRKCLEALDKHSTTPHQIYIYDNSTNYMVAKHFALYCEQYIKGKISQVTFTTNATTFDAFSKASTFNFFGQQHESDPLKNKYKFLVCLDNDIIVMPEWDRILLDAWSYIKTNKLNHIKVLAQNPGGIKSRSEVYKIKSNRYTLQGSVGELGGSGLWSLRNNFFEDVGFLNLTKLAGLHKQHDQHYWRLLKVASGGKPYIMGLDRKLGVHCGKIAGSVCNRLTRNKNNPKKDHTILFKEAEEKIGKQTFDEFFKSIVNDDSLINNW